MKDITFGQYIPSDSFVHKMDARAKIVISIAYIVGVFLVSTFHFLGFAACLFFVLFATAVARVPFGKVLRSVRGILFFIIFSAILQIFFNKQGKVVFEWSFITVTENGLLNAAYIVARITLIIIGASLLTFTTTPVEIADGIESLLTPLKIVKFPVHEFALIMSIALRFIPTLMNETDKIIKAQKARGADFESGNIFKRAKALIPVLIPLLVSSFRRADELADAMDARCYSGSKTRTRYKKLKFTYRDCLGVLFVAALITGVVLLNGFYVVLAV